MSSSILLFILLFVATIIASASGVWSNDTIEKTENHRKFCIVGGGPAGVPSDIPYNWEAFNRNKRSVAIDLSKEGGRDIIYKLVENVDVFVTNLRLSERKKYGLEESDGKD